jgi:hypothetical protein
MLVRRRARPGTTGYGKGMPPWGHVRLDWGQLRRARPPAERAAPSWLGMRLVWHPQHGKCHPRQAPAQPAAATPRDMAAGQTAARPDLRSVLRLVKGYCPPSTNDSIDQALAVSEPCAVCQSAAACVLLHPCGHVLCQTCLGKAPTVCPASSCGEALQWVRPQWGGSFGRLRTRDPHQYDLQAVLCQ